MGVHHMFMNLALGIRLITLGSAVFLGICCMMNLGLQKKFPKMIFINLQKHLLAQNELF